jgi:hypothetical protein
MIAVGIEEEELGVTGRAVAAEKTRIGSSSAASSRKPSAVHHVMARGDRRKEISGVIEIDGNFWAISLGSDTQDRGKRRHPQLTASYRLQCQLGDISGDNV